MSLRTWIVLPLVLASACWNPRYFTPRERVDAYGPDRDPAASYAIPAAMAGTPSVAELRVWSRGARARFTDDDREVVELHVGFEIENNGTEALQLDLGAVALEELMIDGVLQPTQVPLRIQGDGLAAGSQTARVDLVFEVAADRPSDIDGFAMRFAVKEGDRIALRQLTPFVPWFRSSPDDSYRGGFWGFGAGFGWHHHDPFFCR